MTSDEFKRYRERLGMTQEQLAIAMDTTRNTVARWERGEMQISGPAGRLIEILAEPEKYLKIAIDTQRIVS